MRRLFFGLCLAVLNFANLSLADDAPILPERTAPQLPAKWQVLYVPGRPMRNVQPLTDKNPFVPIEGFSLTGPNPGHPFVLGSYTSDGKWGIVDGHVQVIGGKNGVLELARGNQFELEGRMEQTNLGGWFLLIGWNEGHGYCISNVVMKESGAPWFLTEFRGSKALTEAHTEFPSFEWKGDQAFKLQVANQKLTMGVGNKLLFEQQDLPNYEGGAIILGTYDTKYGPRALRLKSLRGRELEAAKK